MDDVKEASNLDEINEEHDGSSATVLNACSDSDSEISLLLLRVKGGSPPISRYLLLHLVSH